VLDRDGVGIEDIAAALDAAADRAFDAPAHFGELPLLVSFVGWHKPHQYSRLAAGVKRGAGRACRGSGTWVSH